MKTLQAIGLWILLAIGIFYGMTEWLIEGGYKAFKASMVEARKYNQELNQYKNADGSWMGEHFSMKDGGGYTIIYLAKYDDTCIIGDYAASVSKRPLCYPTEILIKTANYTVDLSP